MNAPVVIALTAGLVAGVVDVCRPTGDVWTIRVGAVAFVVVVVAGVWEFRSARQGRRLV